MAFFFFPGRSHNYLLYLLMEFASPPCPGINNEWSLIEFTLSNARQSYSSTENPSGLKGTSGKFTKRTKNVQNGSHEKFIE